VFFQTQIQYYTVLSPFKHSRPLSPFHGTWKSSSALVVPTGLRKQTFALSPQTLVLYFHFPFLSPYLGT